MDPSERHTAVRTAPDDLAASLLEAWNARDLDGFVAHFSSEYTGWDVNDPTPQRGRSDLRSRAVRYLEAFPDLSLSCEIVLADQDHLAVFWTARGTHRGTFMHIPATHRPVEVRGVALLTIEGGLIRQGLFVWDTAGMLRGLGMLPRL